MSTGLRHTVDASHKVSMSSCLFEVDFWKQHVSVSDALPFKWNRDWKWFADTSRTASQGRHKLPKGLASICTVGANVHFVPPKEPTR